MPTEAARSQAAVVPVVVAVPVVLVVVGVAVVLVVPAEHFEPAASSARPCVSARENTR